MPVVTLTANSPRIWLNAFLRKDPQPKKKLRKKRKGFVYCFRRIGRAFQNRQGPGRKTKGMKNGAVTHLHSNRLG